MRLARHLSILTVLLVLLLLGGTGTALAQDADGDLIDDADEIACGSDPNDHTSRCPGFCGLPRIDVVLVSHGHYDHLDRASLAAVARCWPEAVFAVPLGQERSLPRVCQRVIRLGWWQSLTVRGVQFTLTPAQHWHRRGPFDQDRALWGGWHLRGSRSVFHSGDTGYFEGFRTIARVLGAPDIAVLPLGAYEPRWFMAEQHMSPEDSLQAFVDLGARAFMGMHWGTFDLTDEPADHGAFTLLPEIAAARGLSRDRLHVLGHGGALGFGGEVEARGAAPAA